MKKKLDVKSISDFQKFDFLSKEDDVDSLKFPLFQKLMKLTYLFNYTDGGGISRNLYQDLSRLQQHYS